MDISFKPIEICNAYSITGRLISVSHLELENTGWPESYTVYRDTANTYDPDMVETYVILDDLLRCGDEKSLQEPSHPI